LVPAFDDGSYHYFGDGSASAMRIACRTAGRLGYGAGRGFFFFPCGLFEAARLQEGEGTAKIVRSWDRLFMMMIAQEWRRNGRTSVIKL
jgi:hypothetical protein